MLNAVLDKNSEFGATKKESVILCFKKQVLHLLQMLHKKLFSKNMSMAKTTRKRKLQAEHHPRAYKGEKIVPSLHLAGVWLEQHGFKPGDQVEITTREKLLIIQPVNQVQEEISGYKEQLREMKQQLKKLL